MPRFLTCGDTALTIELGTTKNHVHNILEKLQVTGAPVESRSRVTAVRTSPTVESRSRIAAVRTGAPVEPSWTATAQEQMDRLPSSPRPTLF